MGFRGSSQGVPIGTIFPWPSNTLPDGVIACDGAAVNRTTYSELFSVVGETYGAGDGATTFNLPDLRGRVAVGKGTHADVSALAGSDGVAVASRRPKHRHTVAHETMYEAGTGAAGTGIAGNQQAAVIDVGPQTLAPTDTPAYLVCNYVIKASN